MTRTNVPASREADELRERIRFLSTQKRLPEAIALAEQMVAHQTRRLGAENEQTGIALWGLGELQRMAGRPEQAIASFERAWVVFEKHPGQRANLLWAALASLEAIGVARRDRALLSRIYQRELELVPTVFGPKADKLSDVLGSLAWLHHEQGHRAQAESYFRRAVEARRQSKGAGDPSVAADLMSLAMFYDDVGNEAAEISTLREALVILEAAPAAEPRDYAGCLNKLATLLVERSDFEQAEPLFLRAAQQYARLPGPDGVGAAFALANAGMIREQLRDYRGAESLLAHAVAQFEATLGPNHPQSAVALGRLASLYAARNDDAKAEDAYRRLVVLHERRKDSAALAVALYDLANLRLNHGKWQSAESTFQRALQLLGDVGQLESANGVKVLGGFATLYLKRGELSKARSMAQRAQSIAEAKLAPNDPERAYTNVIVAGVYKDSGDFQGAEQLHLRAERAWRAVGGDDAPELALPLINRSGLHREQGNYRQAEQLLLRALEISRKAKDRGRHNVLAALDGLAGIYAEQGEYQRAAPYAEEVLEAREQAGATLPGTAVAHANLGQIYVGRRDYVRAQQHLERALSINTANADPLGAAQVLLALAGLRNSKDDRLGAEVAYGQVIEQLKTFESVGAKLATARALAGLASLHLARTDYGPAEVLTRQALEAASAAGPANPVAVATAIGLAQLLSIERDFTGAENLLQQTERALVAAAGREHPLLAKVLFGKALVQWQRANAPAAFLTLAEGLDIEERQLVRTLSIGSEAQRALLLTGFDPGGEPAIALHAGAYPSEPNAMRVAMLSILRRKGRLLDAVSNSTRVLRAHLSGTDGALLDQLGALRGVIASRALATSDGAATGESRSNEMAELSKRADALEAQIASRSSAFRGASRPISLERVAAGVPKDAMLVEIATYRPVLAKAERTDQMWGERRYAAYALSPTGALRYVDLGDARAVDAAAFAFRASLAGSESDVRSAGRVLDELVMRPIRSIVGNVRHLLVAPDGVLNVIPFGAMVNEQGRHLIDDWRISYLSTGRDLIRQRDIEPRSPAVVMADPDFGGAHDSAGDLGEHFRPLAFTEREGREVAAALGEREPWLGVAANKRALLETKGPWLLHIATHGFFLDDVQEPAESTRGFLRTRSRTEAPNPLLRSGLALAGANRAGGDGILTALEASSLDLWGTKLVVLSACDTGLGELKNGEGVYGLRRAFAMAGAEAMVTSLWKVDDQATRDLMKAYYTRLARGEGRADALREAQLSLRRSHSNPRYWASFVAYGDGGPLGTPAFRQRAPQGPPPVQASSARLGCGCHMANTSRRGVDAALPLLLGVTLLRRKQKAASARANGTLGSVQEG